MSKEKTTKPDSTRTTQSLTRPIASFDLGSESHSLRHEEPVRREGTAPER
jgi:hypothetical protein